MQPLRLTPKKGTVGQGPRAKLKQIEIETSLKDEMNEISWRNMCVGSSEPQTPLGVFVEGRVHLRSKQSTSDIGCGKDQ